MLLAAVLLASILGVGLLAAVRSEVVAAQEPAPANHAGLVVRHGDGRITYAYVGFAEEEIDGIELLERSGIEQVTISFGGLGAGVCALEGEGCPATECRRRLCQAPGADSPYWRSFGRNEAGAWQAFALGPSATKVRDGDVQAWSWTPDEVGLPPLTLVEVAELAGVPGEGASLGVEVFSRSVVPPGVSPSGNETTGVSVYVVAVGVVGLIAVGAFLAARRARRGAADGPAEEATA